MSNEQEVKLNPSKKEQIVMDTAWVSAVISNVYFPFILSVKKNSYTTFSFISELTLLFLQDCRKHKYIVGKNPINDREGIINWVKDYLREHEDFKDIGPQNKPEKP